VPFGPLIEASGAMENTKPGYFNTLIKEDLVPINTIAKEVNGTWMLTRNIGDLAEGTVFENQAQLVTRVDQAISAQHFKVSTDTTKTEAA
jgi:hypothetical protein